MGKGTGSPGPPSRIKGVLLLRDGEGEGTGGERWGGVGRGVQRYTRRRKMRHINPWRTKIRKLGDKVCLLPFCFKGKISALYRLQKCLGNRIKEVGGQHSFSWAFHSHFHFSRVEDDTALQNSTADPQN